MHRHLHCGNDFVASSVEKGKPFSCRVVANPHGYRNKGEDKAFKENFVVELP